LNPFPASLMSPQERRAELCRLLGLGLVRLHHRQSSDYLHHSERVRFPPRGTGAVMQLQPNGDPHDDT
jgi:hypothetical protein